MYRFEIYQDRHGKFRWRFVSDNGDLLAKSGDGYGSTVYGEVWSKVTANILLMRQ
jgi:hypothetical protein